MFKAAALQVVFELLRDILRQSGLVRQRALSEDSIPGLAGLYKLMRDAHLLRPEAPFIARKLNEQEARLNGQAA